MRHRRGFALMAAMWLVVLMGVSAWELSLRSRARRLAAANLLELTAARAAVDAGLATALSILQDSATSGSFIATQRDTIRVKDVAAIVTIYDPGARIHLNRASADDLRRFVAALRIDAGDADRLAQRIADWRDLDDIPRARGGERTEYLRNGMRSLPSNADFGSIDELRRVEGLTPDVFARVAPYLTLAGTGQVNLNAAPAAVLYSLPGFGDEAVATTLRMRAAHRVLRSMNELIDQLSRAAAEQLRTAMPALERVIVFERRETVVEVEGWSEGSPVRSRAEMIVVRSGESVLVQSRRRLAD
jgi:general secretion pathway protein K